MKYVYVLTEITEVDMQNPYEKMVSIHGTPGLAAKAQDKATSETNRNGMTYYVVTEERVDNGEE